MHMAKFDGDKPALIKALRNQIDADIKRSGLTPEDRETLKLSPLTAEWCDENFGQPRDAYRIPYFDIKGKTTDYYRVRFLQCENDNDLRYMQPAGSAPALYLPPTLGPRRSWVGIAADPTIPLIITEGEKKAAVASKRGLACLGLGGVWSFRSGGRFQNLLPEFDAFNLEGRVVEVCFDTDVMTKREVHMAMIHFARTLYRLKGCKVNFVFLKPIAASLKTGLDDYLLKYTVDDFLELERVGYHEAEAIELLNGRAAYITQLGAFYDFQEHVLMDVAHARLSLGPLADVEKVRAKGELVKVPAFETWHMHPRRREARRLVYEPGNPLLITKDNDLNAWQRSELNPKRGESKRWREHVEYMMGRPEYFEWFLKWLAYPLQHLGTKLYSAVFIHGDVQGAGKNLVVEPFTQLAYGANFVRIENTDLQSEFNSHAANHQFAIVDEVYVSSAYNRKDAMGEFKSMVTRRSFTLNEKYEKKRALKDVLNYYITSNHADALALEETDRRFFVIEAPHERITYGTELAHWIEHEGGAAHILYYLLHNVDTSKFNPHGWALETEARSRVIELSNDLIDVFIHLLVSDPESLRDRDPMLKKSGKDLFSAEDLYHLMRAIYPDAQHGVTSRMLGHRLGVHVREELIEKRLAQKAGSERKANVYAVFNRNKWAKATTTQWHDDYFKS
jgi:hypothetical protein